MKSPMPITLLATAALALAAVAPAAGQCPPGYDADPDCPGGCAPNNGHCPETTPRPGERRLNRWQYKASHNSFQRGQDLASQIDDHNVFMIELDLHYRNGELIVEHHCFDQAGSQTFFAAINELAQARTLRDRVTFIYLQQNRSTTEDGHCYEAWPSRNTYFDDVRATLLFHFNEWQFYSHAAFVDIDDQRWPSLEELRRRGHNLVVAFHEDEDGDGASSSEDFFFGVSDANPGTECCNFAFTNNNGGCDGGGVPDPVVFQERFLSRAYPGGSCSPHCSGQNGSYWRDALTMGYNFIATNCIDDPHTFNYDEVHSPMPTFVQTDPTGRAQRGTWGNPYVGGGGLWLGYQQASAATLFRIEQGEYRFGNPIVPPEDRVVLDRAIQFEASGGDVTLIAR